MMDNLVIFIGEHFPDNKYVKQLSKILFSSPLISESECKQANGPQIRSKNSQTIELNKSRFAAKDFRRFINLALTVASMPKQTKVTMAKLIWYLYYI